MLTIAGGIILGFIGLAVLSAIVSSETGCAALAGIIGVAVVIGVLGFLYIVFGDAFWTGAGVVLALAVGGIILDNIGRWFRSLKEKGEP